MTVVTVTSCSLLFASPRRDRGCKPGMDTSVHCCDLDEIQSLPVSNVEIQVFVLFGSWGSISLFDTKWPKCQKLKPVSLHPLLLLVTLKVGTSCTCVHPPSSQSVPWKFQFLIFHVELVKAPDKHCICLFFIAKLKRFAFLGLIHHWKAPLF